MSTTNRPNPPTLLPVGDEYTLDLQNVMLNAEHDMQVYTYPGSGRDTIVDLKSVRGELQFLMVSCNLNSGLATYGCRVEIDGHIAHDSEALFTVAGGQERGFIVAGSMLFDPTLVWPICFSVDALPFTNSLRINAIAVDSAQQSIQGDLLVMYKYRLTE